MNNGLILIIPILFPIIGGLTFALLSKAALSERIREIIILLLLAVETGLICVCLGTETSFEAFRINDEITILLSSDGLSRLFAGLVALVWLLVGIYAIKYMHGDGHLHRFFCFYIMAEGAVCAVSFAGNILTFYMFFEIMTMLTFPLVMHDMTHEAIRAGLKYLFYSVAGAFMTLFGIFMLMPYGVLGRFTAGGMLDIEGLGDHRKLLLICVLLMLVGLGTKAGMFPMHSWLVSAHPEAPAPASAVLSGVITKTGVIGIIRVVYYCVGPRLIAGTWVQSTWIALSLFTVLMGSMLAYREPVFKKRLAYSTVSQVSYILFGLSVMNSVAFAGAVSHIIFHSLIKTTLFLAAGVMIHETGQIRWDRFGAVGKQMPVTTWCYAIVSLALVGIPPLSGFVSKWYLATGALLADKVPFPWAGPVILLASALLTAGYLVPVFVRGFFPGPGYNDEPQEKKKISLFMTIPMIVMTVLTILLGVIPGWLFNIMEQIWIRIF